jgi:hypothetical protein
VLRTRESEQDWHDVCGSKAHKDETDKPDPCDGCEEDAAQPEQRCHPTKCQHNSVPESRHGVIAGETAQRHRDREDHVKRYGKPEHPSALSRYRCLQFVDPYTGRPFDWEFVSKEETIEVTTARPLIFSDPKSMLEECLAGTGVAQIIGWGIKDLLARGVLIDLFPAWHGERFPLFAFHPSRKHPPAKVRAFVDFCITVIQEL